MAPLRLLPRNPNVNVTCPLTRKIVSLKTLKKKKQKIPKQKDYYLQKIDNPDNELIRFPNRIN